MTLRQSLNAVVVAHPDDEALWLSSVVHSVERIVFGFGAVFDDPGRSRARRQAVAALPLSWTRRTVVKPDLATARALMQVYRRYGAWTWTLAHRWPAHEVMYAQPPGSSPDLRHRFSGEKLLDVGRLRWWPPPWRSPWRLLIQSQGGGSAGL